MPDAAALLEAVDVTRRFPGVLALDSVSLRLLPGEVVAVIGENGAGKSTLMKVLAGIVTPDRGALHMDGRPLRLDSPRAALARGIALIHQELVLADNLSVADNLYLGREPGRFGWIDQARMEDDARAVLERVGLRLDPATPLRDLSLGQQQMVEIAKALSIDARVLIMDEPTSSLSSGEAEHLFRVVHDLRRNGVSVLYISHRLGEVQELADRVVVLRDGRNAGELARDEIDHDRMVCLMVGRDLDAASARCASGGQAPVLEVQDLVVPSAPEHRLSFRVCAGERVGIAGLVGAGRTELLRVLFGVDAALGGTVKLHGQAVKLRSPRDAIRHGVALVPEDRKAQGLFLPMGVRENVSLASLHRHSRAGLRSGRYERELTREMTARLGIRTPGSEQPVQLLSGGNQQKVVLARWLALRPRLLLLDEPTRGIDVGARHEIYELVTQLTREGLAVLFVSSEMEEVLTLADRVLVMHEGRLAGELQGEQLCEESVMRLAAGMDRVA